MSLYQAYLTALRQNPSSLILVRCNADDQPPLYRAFERDATLAATVCKKQVRRIERHQSVDLTEADVTKLQELEYNVILVDGAA